MTSTSTRLLVITDILHGSGKNVVDMFTAQNTVISSDYILLCSGSFNTPVFIIVTELRVFYDEHIVILNQMCFQSNLELARFKIDDHKLTGTNV